MYLCIIGKSPISLRYPSVVISDRYSPFTASCHVLVYAIVLWNHQDPLKVSSPLYAFQRSHVSFLFLELPSIAKSRKRARKVLHPIATDTEIERDISCSSPTPLNDSVCASPARRPRLLNPGTEDETMSQDLHCLSSRIIRCESRTSFSRLSSDMRSWRGTCANPSVLHSEVLEIKRRKCKDE